MLLHLRVCYQIHSENNCNLPSLLLLFIYNSTRLRIGTFCYSQRIFRGTAWKDWNLWSQSPSITMPSSALHPWPGSGPGHSEVSAWRELINQRGDALIWWDALRVSLLRTAACMRTRARASIQKSAAGDDDEAEAEQGGLLRGKRASQLHSPPSALALMPVRPRHQLISEPWDRIGQSGLTCPEVTLPFRSSIITWNSKQNQKQSHRKVSSPCFFSLIFKWIKVTFAWCHFSGCVLTSTCYFQQKADKILILILHSLLLESH